VYRPLVGIATVGFTDGNRLWNGDGKVRANPGQPCGVTLDLSRRLGNTGEANNQVVPHTPDGVVSSPGLDHREHLCSELGQLSRQETVDERFVYLNLVLMHPRGHDEESSRCVMSSRVGRTTHSSRHGQGYDQNEPTRADSARPTARPATAEGRRVIGESGLVPKASRDGSSA
jgi:hypothetical protein